MFSPLLTKIIHKHDLSSHEIIEIFTLMLENKLSPSQIGAFLAALSTKGETIEEITGAATVLRKKVLKITPKDANVLDTCGTGGDRTGSFNISTATAIVASSCGITVAKHGNKAVTSKSGSADVLDELGVNINIDGPLSEQCINETGIAFLFAPLFHQTMKYVAPVRKELGIRTIFNILGPLCNPANAKHQLMGVFDPNLTHVMTEVLKNLDSKHAIVVHGEDGLDEVTLTGKTKISELKDGFIKNYSVHPEQFGLKTCSLDDIRGGDSKENAQIIEDIFSGKLEGPKTDIVVLNSAFALYAADTVQSIEEGIKAAQKAIQSGKAKKKLESLIAWTNQQEF